MAQIPITVTIDPNNQIRCSPDPAVAPRGNNTLVWRAATPGVELEAIDIEQGSGQPPWPGSRPAKQQDGTITATDPVEEAAGLQVYKYSVTVSKNGQQFSVDPEVHNDPGS